MDKAKTTVSDSLSEKEQIVKNLDTIYLAGGCLWGVQAFIKTLPGVVRTEAGRANGNTHSLEGDYDGYAECVKTVFDSEQTTIEQLLTCYFEIIDPHSINKQGEDVGEKYRTGVYSKNPEHLERVKQFINARMDVAKIVVEVLPLTQYVKSAEEHQDRLERYPHDYCHISPEKLNKYKNSSKQ